MNEFTFILLSTLSAAVPLILASLAGVISERAGVVNLALEGLMLSGAFAAMLGADHGSLVLGLAYAILVGAALAALLAVLAIKYKTDQIVAGFAFNILAVGITNSLLYILYPDSSSVDYTIQIPWQAYCAGAVLLVAITHIVLYYTPLGLRIRAVGEHPKAAATLGVDVFKIRYGCVIVSGVLAALGGAYLSISNLHSFQKEMSSGKGYIALAAMIFGKWTPLGALGASLFFGFANALSNVFQGGKSPIPTEFFGALPYLLTLIALVGVIGKAKAPAADGIPYDPGKGR